MVIIDYPQHSNAKSILYKLSEDDSLCPGVTGFGTDKWRSGLKYR